MATESSTAAQIVETINGTAASPFKHGSAKIIK